MSVSTLDQSTQDSALASERDLLANIRHRKAVDLAFAMLGLLFVVASLLVLVLLFGQLARDGTSRLVSGHLVKPDGFAPGIRDLVGLLQRSDKETRRWLLQRDTYTIVNADQVLSVTQLQQLVAKPVIVAGDVPAPGETKFEANSIELADVPAPERFSRDDIHGLLEERNGRWFVKPAALPLDFSDGGAPAEALLGQQIAIRPGISKSLPLKVKSFDPLKFQGFFGSMPSREPDRAGVKSALVGSILVVGVTMILAVPLGVAAGIWLEEYGRKNWFTALLEINIANLAGIPSIVWGLMALGLLVYYFGLGRSIQTAGITLGLLVLPIVIMATRESIRAIPVHIREASYACGASKWQTVRYHILPYSMSGILTGSIIGLSRAIGETAPLITIGALTYIAFLPDFSWSNPVGWLRSGFTVVPIQMFNWISRPDEAFHKNAAAAGMILLALTLSMNSVAIVLRYRLRQRIKW
jgi:phosphate transport system permease protein